MSQPNAASTAPASLPALSGSKPILARAAPGLDDVIAAETRLSHVDGAAGKAHIAPRIGAPKIKSIRALREGARFRPGERDRERVRPGAPDGHAGGAVRQHGGACHLAHRTVGGADAQGTCAIHVTQHHRCIAAKLRGTASSQRALCVHSQRG